MKHLGYIISLFFILFFTENHTVQGQIYFRVIDDIPHLPVIDPSTIPVPERGMLVFSSVDSKPMIYTGTDWETLCTNNISSVTPQDYFIVKNGIPYVPALNSAPLSPLSGSIYYSTVDNAVMVYNGSAWSKMTDLTSGTLINNSSFTSGSAVKTYKLPVISTDPAPSGLTAGAFYINSVTKTIRYYDGTDWQDITCYPIVTTADITNITGYTATGGGNVVANGGSNIWYTGICWSPNANPDTALTSKTIQPASGTGIGSFTSNMTGLLPKTTYHVRAYAVNAQGIVYGEDKTFTTPIDVPQIITLAAKNITSITAESGGDITADGGASVTKRGIIWSVSGDPLNDPSHYITDDGSGVGIYPSTMEGLLGNTTYYVRAYAVNAAGTAYGNLVQFTTPAPVPPVLNPIVTIDNVTGSSANCTSTIINNGGALVTERGICYTTDHITYTYIPSTTITPTDIGTFITNLTGLSQGTTYYIRGYGKNSAGTGYSTETSFITAALVHITTIKPSNVAGTTAISGGSITDVGYSVITTKGICWSTDNNPTADLPTKTAQTVTDSGVGDFYHQLTNLTPGKKYYVRAYAVNAAGTAYGNLDSLTTLDFPVVHTITAAAFNNDTGVGGGEVISDGGAEVTERGVCWDTAENPTINSYHVSNGTGLGLYYCTLTGLTANVTYHIRAYARNSVGVAYGEDMTFIIIPEAPVIITLDVSDVTSISAISGGDITSNGGASITKRGIIWSTKGDPLGDPSHVITDDGSGVGKFPSTLEGLLGNTTYYVRAYAVNSYGKSYGNLIQFTTPPPIPPTLNTASISITDVTSVSAKGSMIILNNGGAPVTARGICWSTDRIHYEYAPSSTVTGSDAGKFFADLVGLTPGVTYYAKGYATNSAGTSYTSEVSFITASLASITTTPASSITGTSAVSGGEITDPGNATITARGVCWSSAEIPTTANSHTTDGADVGSFASSMTGLNPGVKYYIRAYAINIAGTAYGNLDSVTTLNYPVVQTLSASSFVNNTATGGGNVISDGGSAVTTRGVCWSTTADPTVYNASAVASGSGLGLYSGIMGGLLPNVTYHVRAYAYNSVGYAYGEDKTFVIIPGAPSVTTSPIHDVTSISAIGGGDITDNGASPITARGIRVSTLGDPIDDPLAIITSDGTGNGVYESTLLGLLGDTTYYVRAYAVNSYGISYGDIVPFVTPDPVPPTLNPSLVRVTDVTGTSGVGASTVVNNGGAPVTARGICLTTDHIHYTYVPSATLNVTDLGEYITTITGLTPGVTYYAKGYATNTAGTGYTNEISFTTASFVSLTTITPSNITYSAAQSGGVISSNGNSTITARGICWSTSNNPTTALATKTTETSNVNTTGSFASTLTGLQPATKYYVRAYAVNVAGTAYGNLDSLITEPLKPATVTTLKPNNISYTTAQSGGTVTYRGNSDITARGICWSLGKNPTIALSTKTSEPLGTDGTGSFSSSITGLISSVKYYVRAYVVNAAGVAYGNLDSLITVSPSSPSVVTVSVTSVTGSSANLAGEVVGEGGSSVTERGICWSINASPTTSDNHISSGSGLGTYSVTALNLLAGTTYHARAYAINSAGVTYGDDLIFTTDVVATITTTAPTGVTNSSAISGGSITNDGGDPVTSRGVCWSIAPHPTLQDNYTTDGSGIGNFTSNITGLYGNTRYYVRAYALNTAGVSYGNEVSFVTSSTLVPTVVTVDAINVGAQTAEIRGNVTATGGADVTERGICWGTSPTPTVETNLVTSGSGLGTFSGIITGLTAQTKYYARAYAINSIGIAYGNDIVFATVTLPTVITTAPVTAITGATAKGGGTITSDGGASVTTSGLCWSTNGNPTIADDHTTGTIGIGEFIHTMTGLLGNTIYYVKAYAVNSAGIAYGDAVMFMSGTPELATLTTAIPSGSNDGRSFTSGGNVSSNGGSLIISGGLCWSTTPGFRPDTVVYNRSNQSASGSFTATITGIQKGTTYYVRAYVTNGIGTSYGNEVSVTTNEVPMVLTIAPNPGSVTNVSAISGGSILTNGGTAITASGLCWSTVPNPTTADDHLSNDPGEATFTSNVTGLMGNTTYYARAYATNAVGTAYGNQISFTTKPPTLATIQTDKVTLESGTSATGGGTIVSNGGAIVTTRGLFWCTYPNFSTDTILQNKTAETGYFIGSYTHNMKNLLPNTVYYVKAYVINSAGISYGDEVSFTTPALPNLTTAFAYANGSTKATSGGDIADDGGSPVVARGVVWSKVATFNPDTVSVNKTYNGGGVGSFISNLTGLKGNTTYYIQAYATNVAGTAYGNLLSFITDPATLATVTTRDAWTISSTTAYSGGYISDDGGEPVTTRGLLWSTVSGFRPDTVVVNKISQTGTGNGNYTTQLVYLKPGTVYYVRAFVVNSVGIAYGKEISFTTLAVPTVTTSPVATSTNGISASGGGTIVADGGAPVTNQGVCWSIGHSPTISLSTKTSYDAISGNTFNSSISGLKPATTYYVRAYASNSQGIGYGDEVTFTTPAIPPTITTTYTTILSKTSVATGGNITNNGGAAVTARGVLWSTDANFLPDTVTVNKTLDGLGSGTFTSTITGMNMSITYYIRAYATNSAGTAYGNQVSVTIFPTAPRLITKEISQIGGYSALSGGDITSDGGAPVTLKGLCWATHTNPTVEDIRTYDGSGTDSYVSTMTGLQPNTLYYVRAYAINKIGTAYGIEKKVLTNALPTLTATKAVTNIIATTATSGGEITDDGRTSILARGICWSIYSNPTVALETKTVDNTTIGIGDFMANMTGLKPETVYYVRAYATNAVGTAYGSQVMFKTKAVVLPTVTTTLHSYVDSTQVISGGNVLNDGGMPVNVRGVCWSLTPYPTVDQNSRTYDSAGGLGTYISTITGLLPGTKYYIRAFATNSLGTAYGLQDSVVTYPVRPSVSIPVMSNIKMTTADAVASVITDGGSPITDKGVYWNTTGIRPFALNPGDSIVSNGPGGTAISGSVTNLTPNTTYYIWAYAVNSVGVRFSQAPVKFTTPTLATVITLKARSVWQFTAVSGGNITSDGGAPITQRGVCYSYVGIPTIDSLHVAHTVASTGTYSLALDSLKEGTTYYVRAYAINTMGINYGQVDTLTTLTIPTVITNKADSIWSTGVRTSGKVIADGGMPVTVRGVCWSSTELPTIALATRSVNGNGLGQFISTINGLVHDSVYFIRAYATNSLGTAYGKTDTVRTLPIPPILSEVKFSNVTDTSVVTTAEVMDDGGAAVTKRGICWNTTGNPTINDHVVIDGAVGVGVFKDSISGLTPGPSYYVRAFAINSAGVGYGPDGSSFKSCPSTFIATHVAGYNGAPVSKTVTYHSISTSITGALRCWLTQDLGADTLAKTVTESAERSAGWYWQFNRKQGYKHNGTTLTPSYSWSPWVSSISESSDWSPSNDPCNLLLGLGWRLPTQVEWSAAAGAPQNWANANDAWKSVLQLHNAGYLEYSVGALTNRGAYSYFWSSSQYGTSYGYTLGGGYSMTYLSKAYALPVRCIRDTIIRTIPMVSNVVLPDSSRTTTSALGIAVVVSDGGYAVTKRGLCWSTSGTPTISDNVIDGGSGTGSFSGSLTGLVEGTTYYVRAFATNSKGISYSPDITTIISCPVKFDVIHTAGANGAPVSRTVTYHSVAANLSGKTACWLTQNLGAYKQPTSMTDANDSTIGWYFQFNRKQGYIPNGTSSFLPKNAWETWPDVTESSDWVAANDPCSTLLGTGWRVPTFDEWTAADAPPQNWNSPADAYNSVLKLHMTGWLAGGAINYKGTYGFYWSGTQYNSSYGYFLELYSGASLMAYSYKSYACPVRCIRQSLTLSVPSLSNVAIPDSTLTTTTADCLATVVLDGGSAVTDRGICWNTTGNPTVSDNTISGGHGTGSFSISMYDLEEGPTYYVRAYATNGQGTAYSPVVTSFKICPSSFDVIHTAGLNGAPVTKTVTYHSINTSISGKAACWLTQNLGADRQATAVNDATEAASGWYWQFNRKQGYKHSGTTLTPSNAWTTWTSSISESYDWAPINDPCNLLLGLGWRIPTKTEWTNAVAPPQYWTNANAAWNSVIKLHNGGYLEYSVGALTSRGTDQYMWASTQYGSAYGDCLYGGYSVTYLSKAYATPLRCIRDSITISAPSVSDIVFPTSGMTATTANGTATVASDGGSPVTARGLCWNTTGAAPTLSHHVITDSETSLGSFTLQLQNMSEDSTYYVRAYATNSKGTSYSPTVTTFKICPPTFNIIHTVGTNGAPVSKTVTYHSISSSISGSAACWLTQNLGASKQATSMTDANDSTIGWYFQFNRKQGYIANGTSSFLPKNAWESWPDVTESSDWVTANDPCNSLLGTGWRVPTLTEWTAADAPPQNWNSPADAYNSVLKLHMTGWLAGGAINYKGTYGFYWSSGQYNSSYGYFLELYSGASLMAYSYKSYACPVRCIRTNVTTAVPMVSNVSIPDSTITTTTAKCYTTITTDGGSKVTERGLCWNTTGSTPVITDNKIPVGDGLGSFPTTLGGLTEGPTYYVRGYAINSKGVAYSTDVTSFKICPRAFDVIHTAGLNGAPVSKTVTYHSINTSISGKAACWLTQNLGADRQATALNDATEASSGWYWQFNRKQGYKHDGTTLTPSNAWTAWTSSISENYDWASVNDPCNLLLGLGWRIPTKTEWTKAVAPPQYWTNASAAWNSVIKMHNGGYLEYSVGALTSRGTDQYFWASTQYGSAYGDCLYGGYSVTYLSKAYATPLRCIRDSITISAPSVSNIVFPTSGMTATTADGTATVASDGGAAITARGLCWSTSSTTAPTLSDHVITDSNIDLGNFTLTVSGLTQGPIYYVRAYATNSQGTSYSPTVTSFRICPQTFTVIHTAGTNGAPVSKTVTYNSISSSISGSPACWLTQNLGADKQATSVSDTAQAAAGWYFQFNRKQGYIPNGTSSFLPKNAWESWPDVAESSDWVTANDPCNSLLGTGWRVPTLTEWTATDAPPQNWNSPADAYNSVLKLHMTGWLAGGAINYKGTYGFYWSSGQYNSSYGYFLELYSGVSLMAYSYKSYACPVRCIRQDVTASIANVSNVDIPDATIETTKAACSASVPTDGGSIVTERGFCWNTTGTPTTSDNKIAVGSGVGSFSATMTGLGEGPTYYVRAYAINGQGTAYSPVVASFKICPRAFNAIHTAGLNGAPVSKTVTYHSINASISGKAACWLTQNLGADRQATALNDATESSSGWYWQFNQKQGYKHDGSTLTPSNAWTAWTSSISENSDWTSTNDPCNLLLGLGWRIPTKSEWTAAVAPPQYWTNASAAWNSVIKLHNGGYLEYSVGALTSRGTDQYMWAGTQYGAVYGDCIYAGSSITYLSKAYATPLRCIRDQITITAPSVSNIVFPTSGMTANSAAGTATVASDGGDAVTERGLCWSTSSTTAPTLSDNVVKVGNGIGNFTGIMASLSESPVYYVRAYATNSKGTSYSPTVTSFKICPQEFTVIHSAGTNGAPVSKTVTYHSISSSISGSPACWLTQNLGADQQASSSTDVSDPAIGWYFQFNRKQGYIQNGTSSFLPKNAWETWPDVAESSDWVTANDPCNTLLGTGWRVPTLTEWTAADAPPQNWTSPADAYNSVLKLNMTGWLAGGAINYKGSYGFYWSSGQYNSSYGYFLELYSGASLMAYSYKSYACPVRCIRQDVTASIANVSNVDIPDVTIETTKAACSASVPTDGGSTVTERGFCWNTTGTPTTADTKIAVGSGVGSFSATMTGLGEGPTYYVRAYAINGQGTAYSPVVASFKICPRAFDVIHTAGLNGAPVTKTVTYHSINTSISGKAACWLTQNLGATQQATALNDATEASSGWYWQFNQKQGYKHDGSTLTPSNAWTAWTSSISENSDWTSTNDPCNLLLGLGWRIPTKSEWTAAVAPPQYWTNANAAWNSVIKLHNGGYLEYSVGALTSRGTDQYMWAGTQYGAVYGDCIYAGSAITYLSKAYATPLRCIRDQITITAPSVSNISFPTSGMTANSAAGTATVAYDGGAAITAKGLCWSTSSTTPTLSDNVITDSGTSIGVFTLTMSSLSESPVYYVRAYATNSKGTTYSSTVTSFKICPQTFTVIHSAGINGAPVSKTVTYNSISSSISGSPACWLTQNLGADQQASSATDVSDPAVGWYFQFNRKQGYIQNGTSSFLPKNAWETWPDVTESSDWVTANDPCNALLGTGWRVPTLSEWTAADAPPQNWNSPADAYNSVLKLNMTGWLAGGAINYKGTYGFYWSSGQYNSSYGYFLELYSGASLITYSYKSYACPVRCIRQDVISSAPVVGVASIPNTSLTASSAGCSADVTIDGGSSVTERGFCWNTTGTPTTSDTKIAVGSGVGSFSATMTGLSEGPTYYVRAYATNTKGTTYSTTVTSFKICPSSFSIQHTAGVNGAPVTKNVTYHSINATISGQAACWLTQNLGATQQPSAQNDATEASSGWYWQFNQKQGYQHDGTTRTPATAWTTSFSENSDWATANDPCTLLLGAGWRIPTKTEWTAAVAPPQYWTNANAAWNSVIKLHNGGYLEYSVGALTSRGTDQYFWAGTQYGSVYGDCIYGGYSITYLSKAYATPLRCLRP